MIIVLEPEEHCRCGDPSCRTKIREEVTEILERQPSQLFVKRYVRPIYACRITGAVVQPSISGDRALGSECTYSRA